MVVSGAKLGLKTDEKVCIIDLKFDKNHAGFRREYARDLSGLSYE
jgi:hypothetical protein